MLIYHNLQISTAGLAPLVFHLDIFRPKELDKTKHAYIVLSISSWVHFKKLRYVEKVSSLMSLSVTGSLKKTLWQKVGAIIAPNEAMNYKGCAPLGVRN